jgi:hypothetical protein
MIVQIREVILLIWIISIPSQALFSQSYKSNNNYTGVWQTPSSWIPTWPVPQKNFTGDTITIYGYIKSNVSLSFADHTTLTINDTLVVEGDLSLGDHTVLTINDNGILIVRGNLSIGDHTIISANAYFIVSGNVTKSNDVHHGSFTSNDNPEKVFIGGTISPITLTEDNPTSPIFNCTDPPTTPYPGSNCSYGNFADFMNDPMYNFYQTACTIATPTITFGGPTTFCSGGSITLTSSPETTYLWSTGATTSSINVNAPGNYSVRVTSAAGCQSAQSVAAIVTVNALLPAPTITAGGPTTFCEGGSVTLASSAGSAYLWSNGATTPIISVTTSGSYTVKVTNANGCQSAPSSALIVTVNPLPAQPAISASGPLTFCSGGSVTLTSSAAPVYLWSDGETTASINVNSRDQYTVQVKNSYGCQSVPSVPVEVIVNETPVAVAGPDQDLKFTFETQMNAELSGSETGIWSLITGSGEIDDIHSPVSIVSKLCGRREYILVESVEWQLQG